MFIFVFKNTEAHKPVDRMYLSSYKMPLLIFYLFPISFVSHLAMVISRMQKSGLC